MDKKIPSTVAPITGFAGLCIGANDTLYDITTDGFGYVSLATLCASLCNDTTTIRVPIIQQSPAIECPSVICAGQQYEYSFPLWAATQYSWGALGFPFDIVGTHNDYKVVAAFSSPGTYTLHGWYQNEIKLCGANVDKVITVVPAATILGSTTLCQYSTDTFYLSDPSYTGSWTLSSLSTGSVVATGSGNAFANTFTASGLYLLSVTGSVCADPVTISVTTAPAAIDSVSGPDTVCLDRVYTYTAHGYVPGTTYNWQATGGTVSPMSGSATVNVTWDSYGTKQLIVNRVNTAAPYCSGLPDTVNIIREVINPFITGDSLPCANSYQVYNSNYTRGEEYDWTILPGTAGSVTSGNHSPVMTALWNNTTSTTAAFMILTVHKCDSIVKDTIIINITPSLPATISSGLSPACPGAAVAFTAAAGGGSYLWNFGDGFSITTSGNTVSHAFPPNTSTGNMNYTVVVAITPDPFASCPVSGTASLTESILPGPVATLSTGNNTICAGDTDLLVGTVTTNVTGLTYVWAGSGVTTDTLLATAVGTYYYTVTASNGCSAVSNPLILISGADCGAATVECDFGLTSSDLCNSITVNAASYCTGTWSSSTMPLSYVDGGLTLTAYYGAPGIYWFTFTGTTPACPLGDFNTIGDTVGIVPDFYYRLNCGTGGTDTITLGDHTAYLPFWTITGRTWTDLTTGGLIAAVLNPQIVRNAPGTYNIEEMVVGTRPGGATFFCTVTHTIILPGPPNAAFTDAISPICEGVPIQFTPTSTAGILGYYWEFGDGSSNLVENPERTYLWNPSFPLNPQPDTVILTVTDSIGCEDSVTHIVNIYDNTLFGNENYTGSITPNIICSDAAPFIDGVFVLLPAGGTPPFSYVWSNGTTTSVDTITQSGSYWVTITDAHECELTLFPAQNIKILQPPAAIISGRQLYCIGDVVTLSGYAGAGVTYQWLRGGILISTLPTITDPGLPVGTYAYQLIIGISDTTGGIITSCADTATDTIQVFPLPAPPVITGPVVLNCQLYQLQLTASEPVDGIYNWSDSTHGPVDSIYTGGPYRVWFTNLNGCINHSDIYVPMPADNYFPYFPTGCYSLCQEQFPLVLSGPPNDSFAYWAWLAGGTIASSGTHSVMSPYSIDSGGFYQWELNTDVCRQLSDTMDVTVLNCGDCNAVLAATVTCTPSNPASYSISVYFASPGAGTTYTLGTNLGPIDPFSGTLTSSPFSSTLTFTTLTLSPPDSVTVELELTLPDGAKCFQKVTVPLPTPCDWVAERSTPASDSIKNNNTDLQTTMSNALLVFPNPTSGDVTISYDYGTDSYTERNISVYDAMGRRKDYTIPQDVHGNWNVNTSGWMPGMYIIRMEADGKALQTQRFVVVGR